MRTPNHKQRPTELKLAATILATTTLIAALIFAAMSLNSQHNQRPKKRETAKPTRNPASMRVDARDLQLARTTAQQFARAYASYQDARNTGRALTQMRKVAATNLVKVLAARPPRPVLTHTGPLRLAALHQLETAQQARAITFEALYRRGSSSSTSTITVRLSAVDVARVVDVDGFAGATS